MKTILTLAALLLPALAQANTYCTVDGLSSKAKQEYGNMLFTGEISATKMLVIDAHATKAREFESLGLTSMKQWKQLDGSTLVSIQSRDGNVDLSVTEIGTTRGKPTFPVLAITSGPIVADHYLNLVVPAKKISAICYSADPQN